MTQALLARGDFLKVNDMLISLFSPLLSLNEMQKAGASPAMQKPMNDYILHDDAA